MNFALRGGGKTGTLAKGELPHTSIHYLLELAQCGRMHTLTVLDACYVRRRVSSSCRQVDAKLR